MNSTDENVVLKEQDPQTLAIEKYNLSLPEEWINEKQKYLELKIFGIGDKEGYNKVVEARKEIKRKRIEIDKNLKAFKEFVKKVQEVPKNLIDSLNKIEQHLEHEENEFEKKKEAEKKRKEKERQERVNNRVSRLIAAGCAFDGMSYSYGHEDNLHSLAQANISGFTDAEFEEFVTAAAKYTEEEKARKEAWLKEKKEKEEKERKEREALEQELRAAKEREEAMKKQYEEIQEQLRKQQEAAAALRYGARKSVLLSLGLNKITDGYKLGDIEISDSEVHDFGDAEFSQLVEDIKPLVEAAKKQVEKEAEEQRIRLAKEAAAKEEQEKKNREEREAALRPDKDKLIAVRKSLESIKYPTLEDKRAQEVLAGVQTLIGKVRTYIDEKVKTL